MHFPFWTKGSFQSPSFDTFEVFWWKFSIFLMSFSKSWVHFLYFSKITPLCLFRSNVIYFEQKGSIKVQIFETFMCLDQIHLMLFIFETTRGFFFKFCITLHYNPSVLFLVTFHVSSQKSEIVYIHGILFFKPYKVSAEKALRTCLSWHWKVAQGLKESWLVVSNTWRIWWILTHSLRGLKIWHPWDLLSKVCKVWTETVQRSYFSWHWTVMQI